MKIEIKKNTRGKFFFRVLGGNSKEMLKSGPYKTKRNLAEALSILKAGLPEAKVEDLV
jgi:uncharacterized protein YegP (UPF0339 family)